MVIPFRRFSISQILLSLAVAAFIFSQLLTISDYDTDAGYTLWSEIVPALRKTIAHGLPVTHGGWLALVFPFAAVLLLGMPFLLGLLGRSALLLWIVRILVAAPWLYVLAFAPANDVIGDIASCGRMLTIGLFLQLLALYLIPTPSRYAASPPSLESPGES